MIVLLTGENEFAIFQAQKRLVAQYLESNDGYGLERLDTDSLEPARLQDALLQMPFLVNKKLVIVNKAFANKQIIEHLLELLPNMPEDIDLILFDPKADKRTKLYKVLSSSGSVQEYSALKGASLEAWASEYALQCGSNLSSDSSRYLIDRIGFDQMLLAREIEKLSFQSKIVRFDIDELTEQSLNATVFDLLDRTYAGKQVDALRLYDQLLANRTDPNEVFALIVWQFHALALVKYANAGAPTDVARQTGLHPFVAGKALNVAKVLTVEQIKYSIAVALDIDMKLKTSATDSADAVRVLLLEIATDMKREA